MKKIKVDVKDIKIGDLVKIFNLPRLGIVIDKFTDSDGTKKCKIVKGIDIMGYEEKSLKTVVRFLEEN